MASISEREQREVEAAKALGKPPAVFIHGLWLLPSTWAAWAGGVLLVSNPFEVRNARCSHPAPRPQTYGSHHPVMVVIGHPPAGSSRMATDTRLTGSVRWW
jgi:hypothetical protein